MKYFARIIVLLTALPVHEFAHAYIASRMGDDTAYYNGRVSLNPLDHIDPIGALMIVLFGVGFAKPVPVNSMRFYDRKKGMCLTSLAGPLSNVLLAWICVFLCKLFNLLYNTFLPINFIYGGSKVLSFMAYTNVRLAVFNLLPIPPLDGYHAIMPFLPYELNYKIALYEQKVVFILLALVWLGAFDWLLGTVTNGIFNVLDSFMDILIRAVV